MTLWSACLRSTCRRSNWSSWTTARWTARRRSSPGFHKTAGLTLLAHERNLGKGAAVQTGLAAARGRYTVIVDADLELAPEDLRVLFDPVRSGEAEVVFGARVFPRDSLRKLRYLAGNTAVTLAANLLFGGTLSDVMTGYKLLPTALFRELPLRERGFGIEPEIAAHVLRRGVRVHEVPVRYSPRARKDGKKLTMLDGFRVLRTLLRCRLGRSVAGASAASPARGSLPS